jgi:hypothetical protein
MSPAPRSASSPNTTGRTIPLPAIGTGTEPASPAMVPVPPFEPQALVVVHEMP